MGERQYHQLRGNNKSEKPRHLIFFDVESELDENEDRIYHYPYLICATYLDYYKKWEKKHISYDVETFWNWVISLVKPKTKYWIFAHNVTYDFISSKGFKLLHAAGYEIDNFYEAGRAFILKFIKIYNDGKRHSTIEILNTGNFYQGSVAQLGEAFGIPKLDYNIHETKLSEAIPYCERDVEIIKTAMIAWIEFCQLNNLGNFARTVPGQAFNAFRHRFLEYDIYIHANDKALEVERLAYYGGRVECFRQGEFVSDFSIPDYTTFWYMDINSMYPAVMRDNLYPVKLIKYRTNITRKQLKNYLKEYLVCAEVTLDTNEPAFPFKDKKHIFPTGTFTTFLSTPEIEYAFKIDAIKKIHRVCVYEGAPIFKKYIDFFYTQRLKAKDEKNEVLQLLYKLMLNSLYGKFGQLSGGWTVIGDTDLEGAGYMEIWDADSKEHRSRRWLYGKLFEKQPEEESFNSFPAVAAHVTAYGRMELYKFIRIAGPENVYYSDTDSLFVNNRGKRKLRAAGMLHNKALGKLKIEAKATQIVINAPKDYIFGGEMYKHKGVSKNDEYIAPNTWRQTVWPKIGTLIRENSLEQYFNIKRIKKLKRLYNKGYVMSDGSVKPLKVNNGYVDLNVNAQNINYLREVWG